MLLGGGGRQQGDKQNNGATSNGAEWARHTLKLWRAHWPGQSQRRLLLGAPPEKKRSARRPGSQRLRTLSAASRDVSRSVVAVSILVVRSSIQPGFYCWQGIISNDAP